MSHIPSIQAQQPQGSYDMDRPHTLLLKSIHCLSDLVPPAHHLQMATRVLHRLSPSPSLTLFFPSNMRIIMYPLLGQAHLTSGPLSGMCLLPKTLLPQTPAQPLSSPSSWPLPSVTSTSHPLSSFPPQYISPYSSHLLTLVACLSQHHLLDHRLPESLNCALSLLYPESWAGA